MCANDSQEGRPPAQTSPLAHTTHPTRPPAQRWRTYGLWLLGLGVTVWLATATTQLLTARLHGLLVALAITLTLLGAVDLAAAVALKQQFAIAADVSSKMSSTINEAVLNVAADAWVAGASAAEQAAGTAGTAGAPDTDSSLRHRPNPHSHGRRAPSGR